MQTDSADSQSVFWASALLLGSAMSLPPFCPLCIEVVLVYLWAFLPPLVFLSWIFIEVPFSSYVENHLLKAYLLELTSLWVKDPFMPTALSLPHTSPTSTAGFSWMSHGLFGDSQAAGKCDRIEGQSPYDSSDILGSSGGEGSWLGKRQLKGN